ncbi:ABC transporter permease [Prescottella subtropica]|uniref:ABC transporter permease n=1 Tax=Prescottella subtropica TaxID=2545757 RepID=UPI0010F4E268|nr:ABC transporter permease [Prescottella subtropica]
MTKLIGGRALALIPMLLLITVISVGLIQLIPGDAAETIAGASATPEQVAQIRSELQLDRSVFEQYFGWLGHAVQGDLGRSVIDQSEVLPVVLERLGVTISLALAGAVIGLVLGIGAGTAAALRPGSWIDRVITLLASAALAMPTFWLALILVSVFALRLGWLPATGYTPPAVSVTGWIQSLILPGIALGLVMAAMLARHARASMIAVMQMPHIRTARAMGLPPISVIGKHGLKNALGPVVSTLGFHFAHLLGGAVVVEQVFGVPGIGDLALAAVNQRDIPVIQAVVVVTGICVALAQLLVDVSYGYLNPKVRKS